MSKDILRQLTQEAEDMGEYDRMPTTDPTQPWLPPYVPTPQPQNLKELVKLIWAIWKDYHKQPVKPGAPRCERCGQLLEIAGFESTGVHKPVYACPWCG